VQTINLLNKREDDKEPSDHPRPGKIDKPSVIFAADGFLIGLQGIYRDNAGRKGSVERFQKFVQLKVSVLRLKFELFRVAINSSA
jgi:hypothetical protein